MLTETEAEATEGGVGDGAPAEEAAADQIARWMEGRGGGGGGEAEEGGEGRTAGATSEEAMALPLVIREGDEAAASATTDDDDDDDDGGGATAIEGKGGDQDPRRSAAAAIMATLKPPPRLPPLPGVGGSATQTDRNQTETAAAASSKAKARAAIASAARAGGGAGGAEAAATTAIQPKKKAKKKAPKQRKVSPLVALASSLPPAALLERVEANAALVEQRNEKKKRGRPKGSKNGTGKKKRKKGDFGIGSGDATGGAGATPSVDLRRLDDAEFARVVASEFKRRGYVAALRLAPTPAAAARLRKKARAEEEGATTAEDAEGDPDAEEVLLGAPPGAGAGTGRAGPNPLPLPSFPFHPSPVSSTKKNAAAWDASYAALLTYAATHDGALPLSTRPGDPGDKLCRWTRSQLAGWRRMKKDGGHGLSLDRISKLHEAGMERYAARRGRIDEALAAEDGKVERAVAREDALRASTAGGVGVQAEDFGGSGAAATVDGGDHGDTGVTATGRNAWKWRRRFSDLKKYKEEHGDCDVPRSHDAELSKWCATQRSRCKELLAGEPSAMTPAQFRALEGMGFNMTAQRKTYDRRGLEQKWEEHFQELVEFKEKHGHSDVAQRKGFEEYRKLANWAGLQRRRYKCRQQGRKAGRTVEITDEQIKKLASVGFNFTLQDNFETRFKNLLEFKKEFGHTKVPVFYTGYNNLGRWAKRMRDGIRNNEEWVGEVRKARLLGIDFDIAARRVFGHEPKVRGKAPEEAEDVVAYEAPAAAMVQADAGMGGMAPEMMEQVGIQALPTMLAQQAEALRAMPAAGRTEVQAMPMAGRAEVQAMSFAERAETQALAAEMVEAQAVAAATTMARMDGTDFSMSGPFFYHGYPPPT